jgi:hypothetical protein
MADKAKPDDAPPSTQGYDERSMYLFAWSGHEGKQRSTRVRDKTTRDTSTLEPQHLSSTPPKRDDKLITDRIQWNLQPIKQGVRRSRLLFLTQ